MQQLDEIKQLCKTMYSSTDQQEIISIAEQINNKLIELASNNIKLDINELKQIKTAIQLAMNSLINHDIITKQQIIKPKLILQNLDVEKDQQKIASKLINVGLAALLLSCATSFADVVKKQLDIKVEQSAIKRYDSANSVAEQAVKMLVQLQGSVKGNVLDQNGKVLYKNVHVVYDDNKGSKKATPWNGNMKDLPNFLKNCKGTPTIGYGITDKNIVALGYLTDQQAQDYLKKQILNRISQNRSILGDGVMETLTYKQQAALIALWYNIGSANATPKCQKFLKYAFNPSLDKNRNSKNPKTLLTKNQYLQLAANEFLDCNKAGGKVNKGLTNRVNKIYNWFVSDIKKA